MRIPRKQDEAVEVQMAPLIDIVFLLLIFFLVATTLKKTRKELPMELPKSAAAIDAVQGEDLLILSVDSEGKYYVGSEPSSNEILLKHIRDAVARGGDTRVRIDADRNARYEDVVLLLELCQFEGLTNVGFHTRE
ncbi:MAG: ExbD/TolR family protein [Luteolibacter sp.]